MTAPLTALFSLLVRLETELWDAVDHRLNSDHGLALSWFEPMTVINEAGSATVTDIVKALSITVGGASKLVDRIERAGYVCRSAHPTDGRSSMIQLTEAGKRRLEAAEVAVEDELQRLVGSTLSVQALEQFVTLIRTVRAGSLYGVGGARSALGAAAGITESSEQAAGGTGLG